MAAEKISDTSAGLGACQYPGCTCPQYVDPGTAFGICQRSGCGHRDLDHSLPLP
jgi:hypothetical protein